MKKAALRRLIPMCMFPALRQSGRGKAIEPVRTVAGGWGRRAGTGKFLGSKITLYDPEMVDTGHSTFVQTQRTYNSKSDPDARDGCRMVITYQCRFINCNKRGGC